MKKPNRKLPALKLVKESVRRALTEEQLAAAYGGLGGSTRNCSNDCWPGPGG